MAHLDREALARLLDDLGGEVDEMRALVRTFGDSTAKLVAQAQDAARRGDQDAWHRAAHTLKSSALMLGAKELARLAREAEPGAPSVATAEALAAEQAAVAVELEAWANAL